MKNGRFLIFVLVGLAFVACICTICVAGDVASLQGLKGLSVAVETFPGFEGKLSKEQIKTDVELKLRMAGIKVFPVEQRFTIPGSPFLYVNVTGINANLGSTGSFVACSIRVSLFQDINLRRNPTISATSETWFTGIIGLSPESEMANRVRNLIKDQTDKFINDFLSVNPK